MLRYLQGCLLRMVLVCMMGLQLCVAEMWQCGTYLDGALKRVRKTEMTKEAAQKAEALGDLVITTV